MNWIKITALAVVSTTIISCNSNTNKSDAFGNFETKKITISSEGNGRIVYLNLEEGNPLKKDEIIGQIDTLDLFYKKQQIESQIQALESNYFNIESQKAVLQQQKSNLSNDNQRIQTLFKAGAATQKQKDDIEGSLKLIEKQIAATESQNQAIGNQIQGLRSQIKSIDLAISKCTIKNPVDGVVLNQLAYQNEITGVGKAIYTIADLSFLELKVYISGTQLPYIKLGKEVEVKIDKEKGEFSYFKGKVSWISDVAEFTPKTIQTKEERVNYVYAVKIIVENKNGVLKIGMPGEINFMPKEK